jgi:hypothetical protein
MSDLSRDRLDSWKEIAVFLNRGVRTVQRWEATEGLPVRRHKHRKLGSVFALKSEVAACWKSRSADLDPNEPTPRAAAAQPFARKPDSSFWPSKISAPTPPRTISPTASPKR